MFRLLLLFALALLAACSSSGLRDGPGRAGSNIPRNLPGDAVPQQEPRSRYGNGPSYRVFGKSYRVMDSSYGYQERGVASWYGRKFHGRLTSNREPYDMYGMTAAHKSLPLPTYVRVRNLSNNRSVVVRVNDRGPFVDNRLIDLSYAAARKLDLITAGTGLVEVTAISFDAAPPEMIVAPAPAQSTPPLSSPAQTATPSPAEPIPDPATTEALYIQAGAFGDRENAQRRVRMLRNNGIRGVHEFADRNFTPTLYRVRIGPIADVPQYDSLLAQLQDVGITDAHLVSGR